MDKNALRKLAGIPIQEAYWPSAETMDQWDKEEAEYYHAKALKIAKDHGLEPNENILNALKIAYVQGRQHEKDNYKHHEKNAKEFEKNRKAAFDSMNYK